MVNDILDRLNRDERLFVNEMTKYHMAPRYIRDALKCKDLDNLMSTTHVHKKRLTYQSSFRGPFTEMQYVEYNS